MFVCMDVPSESKCSFVPALLPHTVQTPQQISRDKGLDINSARPSIYMDRYTVSECAYVPAKNFHTYGYIRGISMYIHICIGRDNVRTCPAFAYCVNPSAYVTTIGALSLSQIQLSYKDFNCVCGCVCMFVCVCVRVCVCVCVYVSLVPHTTLMQ